MQAAFRSVALQCGIKSGTHIVTQPNLVHTLPHNPIKPDLYFRKPTSYSTAPTGTAEN